MKHRILSVVLLLASALTAGGCGGATYLVMTGRARRLYEAGEFEKSAAAFAEVDTGGRNHPLKLLEVGMALHCAKKFDESTRAWDAAGKLLWERLGTVSITEQIAAAFGSETALSYVGNHYERVMVHTLIALNDFERGDLEHVGVEIRRIQNAQSDAASWGGAAEYGESLLAEFISGLGYEARGYPDEARITYRRCLALLSKTVATLDAEKTARYRATTLDGTRYSAEEVEAKVEAARDQEHFGSWERLRNKLEYKRADSFEELIGHYKGLRPFFEAEHARLKTGAAGYGGKGRLVLVVEKGFAPRRRPISAIFKLTFFRNVPSTVRMGSVRLVSADGTAHTLGLRKLMDVGAVARAEVSSKMLGAITRLLFRTAIHTGISIAAGRIVRRATKSRGLGWLFGILTFNLIKSAETYDTRSWTTLPGSFWVGVAEHAPGAYTLGVRARDGRILIKRKVLLQKDKISVIVIRVM